MRGEEGDECCNKANGISEFSGNIRMPKWTSNSQ